MKLREKLEAENNQAFDLTGKFKNNAWRDRSTYGTITKGQSEFKSRQFYRFYESKSVKTQELAFEDHLLEITEERCH